MYRFLMVDDEKLVRRGFEAKIDWPGAGFEFLPPCKDGREAIKAIDDLAPDVVMTDIRMPHEDGLSVAAHVVDNHPDTVVVILSGFDEFDYARAAIRSRVFDYVLKPVSSRDLTALLARIKAKLDADRRSRDAQSELRERADLGASALRERLMASFLVEGAGPPSPSRMAAILGFDPSGLSCAAIVAERESQGPADPVEEGARLEAAFKRLRRFIAVSPWSGQTVVLCFDPDPARCRSSALAAAAALCDEGKAGLSVGIGRGYPDWRNAPQSYAEAKAALAYRLIRAPGRPFPYVEGAEGRDEMERLRSDEDRLRLGVRSGAVERVPALADAYLDSVLAAGLSPQRLRCEALALFGRLHDDLSAIGITSHALSAKLACDYYRFAEDLCRREDLVAALERLAEVADGELESARLRGPEWKVLDFKDFVSRHYSEPGLSVGVAAERLLISESYLSKLIRRMLGTSFVDYLAEYRVERAKELLASSDMKGYEVAELVGYSDARYFASLFKRRTGTTPSEYRKSPRSGGPDAE
jgi:two-component system, response regulator YesN